jgi:colanic acid biosynthesis glycosyl transferase WcaI
MPESATALPEAARADPVTLSGGPRVWFVSAVQQENVESTTHIFARLAEALGEVYPTGILAPYGRARASGEVPRRGLVRWGTDRLRRALVGSAHVSLMALRDVRRNDVLIVVTNPPMLPALAAAVARVRGARLVVLVHDVYPDVLYVTGLLRPRSVAGRLLEGVTRSALRRADRIIVIGRDMAARVTAKIGDGGARVVCIPNWADPDISFGGLRPGGEASRSLVVQYSGNMGLSHPVEALLDAAELLQREGAPVEFQVFGWGLKLPSFRAEAERRGLRNLTIAAPCPRAELGGQLAACDVALVLMRRGMSGISVPCRAYNLMAAGRPMIVAADHDAEIARVTREHDLGWVVEPEDPEALAEAIRAAAERRQDLRAMGERAARVAAETYSFAHAVEQYVGVVAEVGSRVRVRVEGGY